MGQLILFDILQLECGYLPFYAGQSDPDAIRFASEKNHWYFLLSSRQNWTGLDSNPMSTYKNHPLNPMYANENDISLNSKNDHPNTQEEQEEVGNKILLEVEYQEKKYLIRRITKDQIQTREKLETILRQKISAIASTSMLALEYYDPQQNEFYVLTEVEDLFDANEKNSNPWKLRIEKNDNDSRPIDLILRNVEIKKELAQGSSGTVEGTRLIILNDQFYIVPIAAK